MKLPPHGSLSPHPPLHPSSFSLCLNIINALKLTKFKRMSKSDLTTIDFDNIDVCDVKQLPLSFYGNVLFVLPPSFMDAPSMYGRIMKDINKMCDGHL